MIDIADLATIDDSDPLRPAKRSVKWGLLTYRTMPEGRNPWLETQIGFVEHEVRAGKPEPVFRLIGYGHTTREAEKMCERRILGSEQIEPVEL
jgi:hypothetical protein